LQILSAAPMTTPQAFRNTPIEFNFFITVCLISSHFGTEYQGQLTTTTTTNNNNNNNKNNNNNNSNLSLVWRTLYSTCSQGTGWSPEVRRQTESVQMD